MFIIPSNFNVISLRQQSMNDIFLVQDILVRCCCCCWWRYSKWLKAKPGHWTNEEKNKTSCKHIFCWCLTDWEKRASYIFLGNLINSFYHLTTIVAVLASRSLFSTESFDFACWSPWYFVIPATTRTHHNTHTHTESETSSFIVRAYPILCYPCQ